VTIPWHRILGMALTQYFAGTAAKVEVEVDLSVQQQRLDIVIIQVGGDRPAPLWPDGFGTPAPHNLFTFKALKDPLNPWALKELVSHGVSYRKLRSRGRRDLLPEEQFRLFAATMQYPRNLEEHITLRPVSPGAYDVNWGTDVIRVLVLREMPEAEQNLVWNLFSSDSDLIARTFERLQPRLATWSSLLNELLGYYGLEGMPMPYTWDDFERDVETRLLARLTPERRMEGLSPEQRVIGLSPEQQVVGLSPEQIVTAVPSDQLLAALPLTEIESYLRRKKAEQQSGSHEAPSSSS
jgi:hypothetical protein